MAGEGREKWQGETVASRSGDGAEDIDDAIRPILVAPRSGDGAHQPPLFRPAVNGRPVQRGTASETATFSRWPCAAGMVP